MNYPKISIVTPNFNGVKYLEKTIQSILNQRYPNLEYIIIDGGSTDGSQEVIAKYESQLQYWTSEPDEGLYHAIDKGFGVSTGEIMGWLNSDDILHPNALFILAKCFENPNVRWVQGTNTVIDEEENVFVTQEPFNVDRFDFLSWQYLINDQLKLFGTIQQESTYWSRELWVKSDGLDLSYKYAGDFALWMRFFRHEKLWNVNSFIGAFRRRSNQLSSNHINEYILETKRCIEDELDILSQEDKKILIKISKGFRLEKSRFGKYCLSKDYRKWRIQKKLSLKID